MYRVHPDDEFAGPNSVRCEPEQIFAKQIVRAPEPILRRLV